MQSTFQKLARVWQYGQPPGTEAAAMSYQEVPSQSLPLKPYVLAVEPKGSYSAKWGNERDEEGAPQPFNWIIRRDPLIVVSGDCPGWGLMVAGRGPTVSPPFFVHGLVRAGVIRGGETRWLDEAPMINVRYCPWRSEHVLGLENGVKLAAACTAWANHGAVLKFTPAAGIPPGTTLVVEIRGMGVSPQSPAASFVGPDQVDWRDSVSAAEAGRASIRDSALGKGLFLQASAGEWKICGHGLVWHVPLEADRTVELSLSTRDNIAGTEFSDYAAAEAETRGHYEVLLQQCCCSTPESALDAALAAAVVTLDHVRDGKAWFEGITRWNTYWAINYQIGAAVAMGRLDEAREALLFLAAVERGPGQVLFSDGSPTTEDWGWNHDALPYYVLQWDRYNQACDDGLQRELAEPVRANLDDFLQERDYAGNGLAGWHLGCNSFLYQADHLSLPGEALSPSIMVARMRRALAAASAEAGDTTETKIQTHAAELVERELLRRFWDPANGAFIPCIDRLGMAHAKGYYTDFIFPALYSQLPELFSWCCLEAADRRLATGDGFFRSGEFLPAGFGNNMVGFVQPCEAAEAYASMGRGDRCHSLLTQMAAAITTKTDCPGSAPESCADNGFGQHAYGFGNPAGAFIVGVVQGLFGLYRVGRGKGLFWRPALPDDWQEGSLNLADLQVSFKGRIAERHYACKHSGRRHLRMQLFCAADEEIDAREPGGWEIPTSITPHPRGRQYTLEMPEADAHELIVKCRKSEKPCPLPQSVRGSAFRLELPAGKWSVEDPCSVLDSFRIDDNLLAGSVATGHGRRFWLVDMESPRAFPVECHPEQDKAVLRVWVHSPDSERNSEHLDLSPFCTATSVPSYGKFSSPKPVRGADEEIEGFSLPPASQGAVVLDVGECDWSTGRLHLSELPHRITIPVQGRAVAASLLMAADGRVRLCGMIVAKVSARYADGAQVSGPVAWRVAPQGLDAAILPASTGPVLAGRQAGKFHLRLDPGRALRDITLEVLAADIRLFVYALNVQRQ